MATRRGREFWQGLISEFERSDVFVDHASFARRHGVRLATFRTWLYRLRAGARRRGEGVRVLPVTILGGRGGGGEVELEVNGIALRFGAGTDPSYLAALVGALRSC